MKKIIILIVSVLSLREGVAQAGSQQQLLTQLLHRYYAVKDGLIAGKTVAVVSSANDFIRTANGIDYKIISEGNINALLKDATAISETGDINVQRRHFMNLSENMAIIARSIRLTGDTIYRQYCPMKKAGWLSPVSEIRNPYYGASMLTCGEVVETMKQ